MNNSLLVISHYNLRPKDHLKKLIELRVQKATRQKFKPDEFSKTKKELAKLLTTEEILPKSKMNDNPDSTTMGN
jgi:ribosomal protein L29